MENDNTPQQEIETEVEIPVEIILGSELESLDSTNYPSLTHPIELSVNSKFSSWEIAEHYLKEYGRQKGFVVNKYRVEYIQLSNSTVQIPRRRTFACEYAGKYKPNYKSKQIDQQRNKGSKKTDCKWRVHLSKTINNNFIHVTSIHLEHNHKILADNTQFATTFRKFNQSIMNEIEHAVIHGRCDAYTIRNLLQPLFPDQLFLTQDLSNAIQKIKREKKIAGTDASHLLKFLLERQKEEPMMFVQPLINADSDRLCGIFWMTENQIILWTRYSDVILHNNTSRTNRYNCPLSLFILVDNDGKSRLGAQAFLNDETQESYEWILQQTLNATGIEPKVIITDMDPAMDVACQTTYKNAYHIHCIWHMTQNLPKRLKNKLGAADFKIFFHDFWKTRNSLCAEVFEQRFQALLNNFPSGSDYLHDPIYSTRHSWARAFTNRIFTAGIQSTQRVESINAIIHKVVNSSSTMAEVAEALDSRMQKEEINKNFIAWKYKSTIYHQPFVVENFFSNVNNIVQKYFSPRIVGEIHKQMCESIIYKCEKLDIKDAFEFIEDQLDQNEIPENQESQGTSNDQEETNNIEDYYDFRQTYLKSLLNSVPKEMIKEVWRIIPYMVPSSYQHIIILNDGTHLCTCLLLVSYGIICRHYFKLMIENPNALFHIMLMPTRWLLDDAWNHIDSIFNEAFIGTSSKNLKPIHDDNIDQRIYLNPRHINHVQEVEIRYYTQKKVDYGRIMGHFKKALNYSFDNNDQKNLDDIILAYIAEKETIMTQLERGNVLKDNNTNNQLKLSDGHTYDVDDIGNPLKRQGKGRPATKRLKACNEQKNKASTTQKSQKENVLYEENIENSNGRKCGLCHKMGHYAPKCPNKKNV
ncbi:protein FAR1-RELATED SEQUENCE 5-like [Rhizophagus irregularis DAOM 181602=DAOM 197198]|nr:protein FAR1-RELATED SEQUENCE 5-like [Rhizophagus irregularis DAOM 181602=DAOM 197198]